MSASIASTGETYWADTSTSTADSTGHGFDSGIINPDLCRTTWQAEQRTMRSLPTTKVWVLVCTTADGHMIAFVGVCL